MKGIVLAGGAGTRMTVLTGGENKHFLPVGGRLMIHYPLATLMGMGVRELLLISTPRDVPRFETLLGDGSQWGVRLEYAVQPEPRGIAEALTIGERFLDGGPCTLILGDNLFALPPTPTGGATIYACPVPDPERFGVVEVEDGRPVSLEEKPSRPRSNLAVTGLYVYPQDAPQVARTITPSPRGELEITSVNRAYLEAGRLSVVLLDGGWMDVGTTEALDQAKRLAVTAPDPEEVARGWGWI